MAALSLGSKAQLTSQAARAVAGAAAAEAERQNLRMSIAVVDDGGYLLYFVRMSEAIARGGDGQGAFGRFITQPCRGKKPPKTAR